MASSRLHIENEDLHWDDVPPKSIFEHRRNLVKVPSCFACNNPASKDDEYFMIYLAFRESAKQEKGHAWLWAKAQRALAGTAGKGIARKPGTMQKWLRTG
jgi:hypothetical protein